jgi:hypothetical protein
LKKLTAAGIFDRHRYQRRPDRYEYTLSEKGMELASVVFALRAWGRRWTKGADLSEVRHRDCGGEVEMGFHCKKCGREPRKGEVSVTGRKQALKTSA